MQIKIEKLIYGGFGMGRLEGKAVFVPYAAPDDVVEIEITESHKSYDHAQITKILEPSSCRIEPKCEYFGSCGGCQLQHMNYESQLFWKGEILKEQLSRVGGIKDAPVLPFIASPKEWGYRSRAQVHNKDGKVGFFGRDTNDIIDIGHCPISDDAVNDSLKAVRLEWPGETDRIEIPIGAPSSFSQVNPCVNEILKRLVVDWAGAEAHDSILELYAGSGNFTFELAPIAKRIIAVEADEGAVEEGKKRFLGNVKFVASNAENFLKKVCHCERSEAIQGTRLLQPHKGLRNDNEFDLVLADPPREGLGKNVVSGILKLRPSTIIYVSCDPSTLSRDLKSFIAGGYRLEKIQPVDMFPQTYHMESVSKLTLAT